MNMDENTFGSADQYPVLKGLTKEISKLDKPKKRKISKFIKKFNILIMPILDISTDNITKNYLLDLMYHHYIDKVDEVLLDKYDEFIITGLKNFIHAKTRRS